MLGLRYENQDGLLCRGGGKKPVSSILKLMRRYLTGETMKYILLAVVLLFTACDKSAPTPKIAAPQREALDKAKGVDQTVQQSTDDLKQKAVEAEK
jgi:hypothetical protein